jgi:hypothetical protein
MTSEGSVSGPAAVSEHAKSRMMQRQIAWDVLSLVYEESDVIMPGNDGCIQLALSSRKLGALAQDGRDARTLGSAQDVAIVLDVASDKIVTVYRLGAHRRRDWARMMRRRPSIRRSR